jgi:2-polyprenyl-3-methyl-5-hydroxy-6-metoxy-1,4-benzoquinol methylase
MASYTYSQDRVTTQTGLRQAAIGASQPRAQETADIETSSDDYARRFSGRVGAWFLNIQRDATLRMLAPLPHATLLDVGGGHGQLAGPLSSQGYKVTVLGSDVSCRQRIAPLVENGLCEFRVGDVLNLPYPDQAFDMVISFRLLPHVTHWQQLLSELCRVARTSVILDYPTLHSVNYIAPQLFRFKKRLEGNTRPYACFDETQIVNSVTPLGFARTDRYPEFFLPMVLHRALKAPGLSALFEGFFRRLGLTARFGSPVILKLQRTSGQAGNRR